MTSKRIQLIFVLLLALFVLGACDSINVDDLSKSADVSQIENAEFYAHLQDTVATYQAPVMFIGVINLLVGWKLKRVGLAINGFVIGGLLIYTYLNSNNYIEDENTLLGVSAAGGVITGILAFFLYNLMAIIIGGAIGTTLMGGAWMQVAENVPPQVLVFVTTFISAMLMFLIFRLFLVAFTAVIGAALLMLAVPYETLWVIPIAGAGVLVQTGIALWIHDDIFSNLRGDMGAAVGEAFGEVLGPFGLLRDRQREDQPVREARGGTSGSSNNQRSAGKQSSAPVQQAPQQQYYQPQPQPQQPRYQQQPPQPQPQQPRYQQPQPSQQPQQPPYYQPQQQPLAYQPPQPSPRPQQPPAAQSPKPPVQPQPQAQPVTSVPAQDNLSAMEKTQQRTKFDPAKYQIVVSDGRTFSLDGVQLTAGRAADNQIVVNDAEVSGHHMVFSIQPEGVVIWDTNSTNGTFFNEVQLTGSQRVSIGDVIRIGATTMRLVARTEQP